MEGPHLGRIFACLELQQRQGLHHRGREAHLARLRRAVVPGIQSKGSEKHQGT